MQLQPASRRLSDPSFVPGDTSLTSTPPTTEEHGRIRYSRSRSSVPKEHIHKPKHPRFRYSSAAITPESRGFVLGSHGLFLLYIFTDHRLVPGYVVVRVLLPHL